MESLNYRDRCGLERGLRGAEQLETGRVSRPLQFDAGVRWAVAHPYAGADRLSSQVKRRRLYARLARPIFEVARAMPTVRTTRLSHCFWAAKTCSTADRTLPRVALPRRMLSGIGLPRPSAPLQLRFLGAGLNQIQNAVIAAMVTE